MNMNPELEAIYAKIPKMECVKGCVRCCGPFRSTFWLPVEAENINAFFREHDMEERKASSDLVRFLLCPYIDDDRCSIYPVRPVVCRLYGVVERAKGKPFDMSCHFVKVEKSLTVAEANAIVMEVKRLR